MKIYGAGIAGLLAGCMFQNARIIEAVDKGEGQHKALLRFRSSSVGDAVGIDFKKVRVHKGIWSDGKFKQPNIQLANYYSQKVVGNLSDRSIWNLDPVDRYIAPEDFIDILINRCGDRIEWGTSVTKDDVIANEEQTISTLPMSVMAKFTGVDYPTFKHKPIAVRRWRIPGANVHQTVYFPDPNTGIYRASITGDMMIAECAGVDDFGYEFWEAFGMDYHSMILIETADQRFGKIAPIDDVWRKKFIFDLSTNYNIFSLGRFGTWRNLLLDDVMDDIAVIKKLMNSSIYDRSTHSAK